MSKRIIVDPLKIDNDYTIEQINRYINTWSPKYGSPWGNRYAVIIADDNKFEGL